MWLGAIGASLLGSMLVGKWINRKGEGMIRACYESEEHLIKKKTKKTPPHPLTNFEIQIYHQNEPTILVIIF